MLARMPGSLLIVVVSCHVKAEQVAAFREATRVNARASLDEPGIARFDVLEDREDPTRFTLIEAYRSADAPAAHKATAHYLAWRDAVADMMAEPRSSRKYVNAFPDDAGF